MVFNTLNLMVTIIIFVFLNNSSAEKDLKSSLVFVIDKTISMGNVIKAVTDGANAIFDTVANSEDSPIKNFILVTFGDPNVSDALVTTNHDVFKEALNSITLESGDDCPEFSMSGIKKAIETSSQGSYVYVFTDAAAKDSDKFEQVKHIAQDKESQIVFILTHQKCNRTDEAYFKLANVTSGQVFNLLEHDITEILKYVKESIRSRRVILHVGKYAPGEHTVHFEADVRTKDMTIAISGSYPEATVTGPEGEPLDEDVLVSLSDILILEVHEITPGKLSITLESKDPAYVLVSAWSDVRFRHGFSTTLPSSMKDTVLKPFPAIKNYLSIKLFGDKVKLTAAKFLGPNYNYLSEIPLKLLDETENIYITDLFYPPKTPCRIAVQGIDLETNTTISRYGIMLIESDKFVNKNPTVNIEGDDEVTVKYDGKLKLKCKVNAYPEPRIIWREKATILPATDLVRDPPYIFTSVLELENLNNNAIYECFAVNRLGIGKDKVHVKVKQKPFFKVLEKPTSIEVDYDAEAVLHCKVDAFPPAKLTWHLYPRKRSFLRRGNIIISPDVSTLTIRHMQPSATGMYVCKAENENNRKVLRAKVTTSAKTPKISKTIREIHVNEGASTYLTCSLIEGKPKPEVRWYRKLTLAPSAEFMEMKEAINQTTISLRNLNRFDTGLYTCRAKNLVGVDRYFRDVFVDCRPTIKDDVEFITADKGEEIKIPCVVLGTPTPVVVWLKDGAPIDSKIQLFGDHSIKLEVDKHHAGFYTCTATNELGSASRTVQVMLRNLEIEPPIKSKNNVKLRGKLNLKCKAKGDPKPTLKWVYFSYDKTVPSKTLSETGEKLVLKNIKESQRGYYVCIASNRGGSKNISYEVDVMVTPKILSDSYTEYTAVDGDRELKISCRATGNPKPVITWTKNGVPLAQSDRYFMEDDLLLIKNVMKSDTPGDYNCEAKNTIDGKSRLDNAFFSVKVYDYPPAELIKNTTTVLIKEGKTEEINCFIPHKNVDTIVWYKDRTKFHAGKLELGRAKVSDSGIYICRISHLNNPLIESANTKVIVGSEPKFVTEEKRAVELEFGESGFLNCKTLGEPKPTVTWWYNRAIIKFSDMVYNFKMHTKSAGEYYCNVTNEFGNITRKFDVTLKGCFLKVDEDSKNQPLMITTLGTWPTFRIVDGYTVIHKSQKIVFSCPSQFSKFPRTDVTAQCVRGSKLNIDGTLLDYTEIKCKNEIKPRINRKRKLCYGPDTKTIQLVFDINHKTIEAFEVCVDRHGNPIYTKHTMRSLAGYTPKDTSMSDGSKLDGLYSCRNQEITFFKSLRRKFLDKTGCCFARKYLVNSRDVFPGPLQRATFNRLNIVPHWSSCHGENWNEVEERVRKLAKTIDNDLIVYTGTAGYLTLPNSSGRETNLFLSTRSHQPISKYLWKVIQYPAQRSSIAIIQLNIPKVSPSNLDTYILCRDICRDLPWMKDPSWRNIETGYTFCCELDDFEIAFRYRGVFEPYFSEVLNITVT